MAKHVTYSHIFIVQDLATERQLLDDALADPGLVLFLLLGKSEKLTERLEGLDAAHGILKSFPAEDLGLKDIQCFWIQDLELLKNDDLKTLVDKLLGEENRAEGLEYKEQDFSKVAALSLAPKSNQLCAILYHDSISSIKVNSAATKALLAALKAKKKSPDA